MSKASSKFVMTDLDLFTGLSDFNQITRLAIITCFTLKLPPEEVCKLTWVNLKTMRVGRRLPRLLNSLPRHVHSDLVFWTMPNGKIEPLSGLSDDVERLIGVFTFDEFSQLFDEMVYVNESSKAFIREMSRNIFNRMM